MRLNKIFFLFFLIFTSIIFGSESNLPLDTLLKNRMIDKNHAKLFSKVLVQDDQGRIKPFHTLSSEIIRKISRKEKVYGQDHVQIVLGMTLDPLLWQIIPIIKVSHPDVLSVLNTDKNLISFVDFFDKQNTYILTPYVEMAYAKKPIDRTKFDKSIIEVDERVNICSMLFSNQLIKIFPSKESTSAPWSFDISMQVPGLDSIKTSSFKDLYRNVVYTSFSDNDWQTSNAMIDYIKQHQQKYAQSILPADTKVNLELLYNNLDPFGWTRLFSIYFFTGLILLFCLLFQIFNSHLIVNYFVKIVKLILSFAFLFHFLALILRWYVSGHAPWSNAYESVIFISFSTMIAGMVFSSKSNFSLVAASLVASMLLFVANLNWLNPEITNLVPVLKSYWLMIHVSIITSSYGFFGLCAFFGLLNMLLMCFRPNLKVKKSIEDLTVINEQSMMLGLFLLTVGTFLGGVWANESWGRYWGWDPKETWALVSIIVYVLILHIRLLKSKKYIYYFNLFSLFGFSSILMTYFGVNFYLDGLHSYAAGDAFPIPSFVLPTLILFIIISIFGFLNFNKWIKMDDYA